MRALTFPLPNKQIGYKREWYRQYDKIEFEGYRFQVEKSYLEWLKSEFGDYMSLPPVEKGKLILYQNKIAREEKCMNIALLTAAGKGTRMHMDIPKQFCI